MGLGAQHGHDSKDDIGRRFYRRRTRTKRHDGTRSIRLSAVRWLADLERLPAGLHGAGWQLCAISRSRWRRLASLEWLPAWLHGAGRRLSALSRPLNLLISRRCNAEANAVCARACRERNSVYRCSMFWQRTALRCAVLVLLLLCAKAHVPAEMISMADAVSRET